MNDVQNALQKKEYTVNCPYCWAENTLKVPGDYAMKNAHPPLVAYPEEFNEIKYRRWKFWAVELAPGTRGGSVTCRTCDRTFQASFFPYDYKDPRNSEDLDYYLGLQKGEELTETESLLDDILDRFSRFFGVKYPWNCFLLFFLLYILFFMIPSIVLGGLSKMLHDPIFPFLAFLFGLMLFLLERHRMKLRNVLNLQKIPLLLSEEYRAHNLSKQFESVLKGWIFGHPCKRVKPPTMCALVSLLIYSVWHVHLILSINRTVLEGPYEGFPAFYTSYILATVSTPYWAMIYFVIGYLAWFILATTVTIGLLTRNAPLDINPLKEMGGTEVFGEMILSSVYPAAALGVAIPVVVVWSFTKEFYVVIISAVLVLFFVFLILFAFFYPLWPIHNVLKKEKEREVNEILEKISLIEIKGGMDLESAVNTHLLLDTSSKVSSMLEWPFNTKTLIKLLSSVLFPFLSLLVNVALLQLSM